MLFHGSQDAGQPGTAKSVVLVENGDAIEAKIAVEIVDPGSGLLIVAAAHIDDIG